MKIRVHNILALTALLWLAGGLPSRAQVPPGNAANTPMDPIISQLVRMGAVEGGVTADAEFDPPVVTAGQPVIFRLVVTASPESTAPPEKIVAPPELEIRAGGSGHTIGFNNLGMQFRTTFIYWVTARTAGTFTIPAFTLSANSRAVPVPAKTLTVLPAGAAGAVRAPRVQVEVPAGNFYIGQKISVPVAALDPGDNSIYGLGSLKGEGDDFICDSTAGGQRRAMRDYDGQPVSALIDYIAVVPVREGDLKLVAQAMVVRRPGPGSLSNTFPGYQPLYESMPAVLHVQHLPKGALPGFTGLIGRFTVMQPVAAPQPVRAGDPMDLTVTVAGEGNLGRLVPPKCPAGPDWQAFPPAPDKTPAILIEQQRSNIFRYTLIPQRAGLLSTPSIPFCYFDPDRGIYVDLTIPAINVQVMPPVAGMVQSADTNLPVAASQEFQTPLAGLSARPVHFAGSLRPWQQRAGFWGAQLVPALVLAGLWYWDKRRRYLAAHPEVVRKAQARRGLRRQRQLLHSAAGNRDAVAFARAAVNALREACAPETAANPAALVGGDILAVLPAEVTRPAADELVRTLFAAVERADLRNEPPSAEMLLALQPELEALLEILGRRLW